MGMPLAIHPHTQSDFTQELDRAGLQNARPNSPQHMSTALPFQYDAVDAVSMEHMGQKQAGGTPADDSHLRSRCHLHVH
jgi:hypothetical protein